MSLQAMFFNDYESIVSTFKKKIRAPLRIMSNLFYHLKCVSTQLLKSTLRFYMKTNIYCLMDSGKDFFT